MIVRRLKDITGTERDIDTPSWNSKRLLLSGDNMGFSMHDTLIRKGHSIEMHYKYHLEAVYCVEGSGEIKDLETGDVHPIEDGTIYALNKHDKHILTAFEDMRMVCVFNPPITGREVHDKDGAYPLVTD